MENGLFLDDLLEGTVDGRSDVVALVEIDGGNGALADTFGGEFELLEKSNVSKVRYIYESTIGIGEY